MALATILLGILLVLVAITAMYLVFGYNRLVVVRNRCDNAWSQIDVQLKKRTDMIPNLVETVKGYAAHEKGVFEEVAKARSGLMNANGVAEISKADGSLTKALKSLFAVAENYPQLKADAQFRLLESAGLDKDKDVKRERLSVAESVNAVKAAGWRWPRTSSQGRRHGPA